jgi:hypothetical protein
MPNLRTRLTLRPGQRGTKKLLEQYGDRLVCVRYRYDERTGKRIKTVELIVDETGGWDLTDPHIPSRELRYVLVEPHEVRLREKIKAAGGRWHPDQVAWSLPHDRIVSLGIADRMIDDPVRSERPGNRESNGRSEYI